MIKISQLKLPVGHSKHSLDAQIRKLLRLKPNAEFSYEIAKRSIDARKKPDLYYVYSILVSVDNEKELVSRLRRPSVTLEEKKRYTFPEPGSLPLRGRPVIVGAGPAGLFAACQLAKAGYAPIVIERGARVRERTKAVEAFWESGILLPDSNVQFGEGGAGTFSDGKLNTGVRDPAGRGTYVLETFVRFGAPEEILYDNKPHIGTDVLMSVIERMHEYLEKHGTSFFFGTRVTDLVIEQGVCRGLLTTQGFFEAQAVILAVGHSARDTFAVLEQRGIPMEAKSFAVGFRVEHPQRMIDAAMYGEGQTLHLPAAPYKVTSNFPNGRGVYSFCMCPGGFVVNASSEEGGTCVNGMSYAKRDTANANSAIIVSVTPADYGGAGPLAGVEYQRRLERAAYALGGGRIPQQLYGDYVQNETSSGYGAFASQAKGKTVFANLRGLLSSDMERSFIDGMTHFSHFINGFDRKDAILSGMETRTSSPVRILRNEQCESAVAGIYPCGEGAGYAGGIMSAAMDGLKVASAVMRAYAPPEKASTGRRARGPGIPGGYDSRDKE